VKATLKYAPSNDHCGLCSGDEAGGVVIFVMQVLAEDGAQAGDFTKAM
jgi:hypothetical protein